MKLFSYSSDLRKAKHVLDLTYMKILRIHLLALGGWPKEKKTSTLKSRRAWHMAFISSLCFGTQILYITRHVGSMSSFYEVGHLYITMLMCSVSVSRAILVFTDKYHDIATYFIESFHLMNHENKSEFAKTTHILVHKISHAFTIYLYTIMILGYSMFSIMPMYTNYSKGMFGYNRPENSTFEQSVYYSMPFDYSNNLSGYIVMVMYNLYVSYLVGSSFCTHDLFLSLMVFNVWGHIRVLINFLDNFPRPAGVGIIDSDRNKTTSDDVKYSDEEQKYIFAKLREGIKHHTFILNFLSKMSDAFGGALFYYYTFHQVCECILLLVCSQMDIKVLLRYGFMTFVIFQQLIQISVVFELLGTSGEKLELAIYALPWECMDTKNRKLVYFMLCRSQQSLNVKALGMIDIGVQTMISIIKTSFSYFVMLRTLSE